MPPLLFQRKPMSSSISTKLLSPNPLPTDGQVTSLAQASLNSSVLLGSPYIPDTILYGASIRWTSSKVCKVRFEIYKSSVEPQNLISSITDSYTASDLDAPEKLTVLSFNKITGNSAQLFLILTAQFTEGSIDTIVNINSVQLACSEVNHQ